MDTDHNIRWRAFIRSQSQKKVVDIVEAQKVAMFRHGWKNPDRNREEVNEAVRDWRETVMLRAKLDENIVSDLMALPYREAFEAAKDLDYRTPIGEREEGAYANWIADNHPEALA